MSADHAPQAGKPLFIVALVPSEPLRSQIRARQEEYAERVASVKALQLPPHITLSAPFICEDPEKFLDTLGAAVAPHEPFTVNLTHLERFVHHPTMYYAIEKTDSLQKLHEDVLAVVKDFRQRDYTSYYRKAKGRAGLLLRVYGSEYVLEYFLPHLSITRHDSDREKFAALWDEHPSAPAESFTAESVVVLEQGADAKWHIRATIPFGPQE